MAFWEKGEKGTQTLSDLIRGLQHSVNTAMEMIETRNIELLGRYFDPDGVPLKKRIRVDEHTVVDVPLISIVNPSTVNIKEVEMDFTVQILDSDVRRKRPQEGFMYGAKKEAFQGGLKRSNLEISFDGKNESNKMHVKIKFESTPIPEGLSRIVDEYDKTIATYELMEPVGGQDNNTTNH